jgi:putative oxidoreductase
MFRKLLTTQPTWVMLPIRLGLGAVFIAHGCQKVLGLFGGKGLNEFISHPAPFEFMKPAWLWMGAAALSELLGGVMVALGFATRLGAFLLTCTMLTAIFGVHLKGGFFAPAGYEYPLALLAMSLSLLIAGAGQLSIDLKLARGKRR